MTGWTALRPSLRRDSPTSKSLLFIQSNVPSFTKLKLDSLPRTSVGRDGRLDWMSNSSIHDVNASGLDREKADNTTSADRPRPHTAEWCAMCQLGL